jgi:hypothetical protein
LESYDGDSSNAPIWTADLPLDTSICMSLLKIKKMFKDGLSIQCFENLVIQREVIINANASDNELAIVFLLAEQ